MNRIEARTTVFAGAALALVLLAANPVSAAAPAAPGDASESAPIVVAQLSAAAQVAPATSPAAGYPASQRGVREAAAQGNEALRRYIWRTRMIYDYYFYDFALRQ